MAFQWTTAGTRWNPLCTGGLYAINRQVVPSPSGIVCSPCMSPVDEISARCCCLNCWEVDFPGITITGGPNAHCEDILSLCGPQTFTLGQGLLGNDVIVGCQGKSIASPATHPPSYTLCRWAYLLDTTVMHSGGVITGSIAFLKLWQTTYPDPALHPTASLQIYIQGPTFNVTGVGAVVPFVLGFYSSTNFPCTGGVFVPGPSAMQGVGFDGYCNTCTTTWPSTISVNPVPCS